jgi:hypothetical protein
MEISKHHVTARIREFKIPPIRDGLILGREAAIGCVAIRQALGLLSPYPFTHIELDDPVASDIVVRESILRRIPRERLIAFVIENIKEHMAPNEILHIDIDIEVQIESAP